MKRAKIGSSVAESDKINKVINLKLIFNNLLLGEAMMHLDKIGILVIGLMSDNGIA